MAKLKCSECEAVLNLAKAPTPGKKVRCPKCQKIFTVPGPDGEEAEAITREPAPKAAAGKPAAKAAAAAPPKPALTAEEEEAQGTYGFLDTGETEEEREKNAPKIEYAPDLTVKDPRGKAIAILAKPSTMLLADAGVITLIGLLVACVGVWPFAFAETVANPDIAREVSLKIEKQINAESQGKPPKSTTKELKAKILKEKDPDKLAEMVDPLIARAERSEDYTESLPFEEFKKGDPVAYAIWELMEDRETTTHIWMMVVGVPLIFYGLVVGYGGVMMQTLHNKTWSIVAAGMAIAYALGGIVFVIIRMSDLPEESGFMDYIINMALVMFHGAIAGAGGYAMMTIFDPKVQEGFLYDPVEAEREEMEARKGGGKKKEDEEEVEDEEEEEADE